MNHYKIHKPQPIELIQRYNLNFMEGNVVKYILRSPFKGDRISDLKKALYYAKLIKPIGYFRLFKESEIDSYQQVLLSQELLGVTATIQSDIVLDAENIVIGYIESAINIRETMNWYIDPTYEKLFAESVTK